MNLISILILTIIATFFSATGSLFLKKSTKSLKFHFNAIKNMQFIIGVLLFGVSTLFYMVALKNGELNMVYPISAFSYIWVSLLSVRYLEEKMNPTKWMGIILIIIGVFLIVR